MPEPIIAPNLSTFSAQFRLQMRVIMAVMIRETKTRYGRSRLGYLMALIEPSIFLIMFILIRSFIGRSTPFGEDIILFMLSGLLTYRIFLAISNRLLGSFKGNKALLAYPPVKPVDILLARVLLEMLTMFCVAVLFFGGLALISENEILIRPETLLTGFFVVSFLGAGMGFFNGALVVIFPPWRLFWTAIRLPLLLASGIFFVPKSMPEAVQPFLRWNPLVHTIEWVRTGVYLTYDPLLTKSYPILFALILVLIGLWLERRYRYKMLSA